MYAVPSDALAEVAVIPEPEIEIVEEYCPVVFVPKATASLSTFKDTEDTFELPSIENDPVTPPPANVTVLELVHDADEPVILVTSKTPVVPENTSEELEASGINVKYPVESSNPKNPVFAVPE